MFETAEDNKVAFENWVNANRGYYPELKLMFGVDDGTESIVFLPVPKGGYHGMFICFDLEALKGNNWLSDIQTQAYHVNIPRKWGDAVSGIIRYLT